MSERKSALMLRMREEGEKTVAFFRGLAPDAWDRRIYADGPAWTVREIMCHFLNVEEGLQALVRDVLAGGGGAPDGMDIDSYNAEHVAQMAHWKPDDLITAFAETRQGTIEVFQTAQESDFDRMGRHPLIGNRSLEDLVRTIYLHNKNHQREIMRSFAREE